MAIRIFESFSGYGSQSMAMERLRRDYLGVEYEVVGISEIDKYAIEAYNALHPNVTNYGDISKIDWVEVPDFDLFTWSFPCTDISIAGDQKGFEEGSGTASSLAWECLKAIRVKRPKYLLMENVAQLVSKKNLALFDKLRGAISSLGYDNYTEILNAKDYGVAQNRPRVFMVSVRRDLGLTYHFPKAFTLEKRLRDYLEPVVDEKYYLSDKFIKGCIDHCDRKQSEGCGFKFEPTFGEGIAKAISTLAGCRQTDNFIIEPMASVHPFSHKFEFNPKTSIKPIAPALRATDYKCPPVVWEPRVMQVGNIWPDTEKFKNRTMGRVYNPDGISPTINCCGGGDREPKIVEGEMISDNLLDLVQAGLVRIRKLTPRECFRLQGLEDCDIDKIQSTGISNSQQYKLAGNSIAIPCLYHLFRKLFVDTGNEKEQMTLF